MATSTSLKLLVLCACAAVAVAAVVPLQGDDVEGDEHHELSRTKRAAKDQSAVYGICGPNDKLVYHELVEVKKGILQIKKKDITYPKDHSNGGSLITCIKIMDQMRNGKNADYKVSSGGVGQRLAIINFRSQRGEPIKYIVHIFGR